MGSGAQKYLFYFLLQYEVNRYGIRYANWFPSLFSGFPFWKKVYYTKCFFVKRRVNAPCNATIRNATIFINYKSYVHFSLDAIFLSNYRIFNCICYIFSQCEFPPWEFGHIFNNKKYLCFVFFFFYTVPLQKEQEP